MTTKNTEKCGNCKKCCWVNQYDGTVSCHKVDCTCHNTVTDWESIEKEFNGLFDSFCEPKVTKTNDHPNCEYVFSCEEMENFDNNLKSFFRLKLERVRLDERNLVYTEIEDFKNSHLGKLWSTAVDKACEAPFPRVAMQYLVNKVYEKGLKEGKLKA